MFVITICRPLVEELRPLIYNNHAPNISKATPKTEFAHAGSPGIAAYDEKNIRRRVYDALNVLMAMDIIIKDKKDISWKGLPSAPHAQLEKLKEERAALRQKILNQQAYLQVVALILDQC